VTTTCLSCGAVLPSGIRACSFCDSILPADCSSHTSASRTCVDASPGQSPPIASTAQDHSAQDLPAQDLPWLGELEERLDAYRARRGGDFPPRRSRQDAVEAFSVEHVAKAEVRAVAKTSPANFQSQLPFAEPQSSTAVEIAEPPSTDSPDDFSFTIAIGRYSPPPERRDGSLEIDVSIPPGADGESESDGGENRSKHYGLYPVASLEERTWAAVIDTFCLLFAYGGFLMLFGSLGGQFTLSKLSAEVYAATLAIVYLQYFALFTVFGGTTPGMMFRGLQVSNFCGESPTPRQMLLRSLGYVISASTMFIGFAWAWWDEDALTWHDRISQTYLTSPETRGDLQNLHAPTAAHTR
jgi:uncharacterized RDD family membrane protein YckC